MRMQFLGKYRETGLLLMRLGLGVLFIVLTGPVLLNGGAGHGLDARGALRGCVGGALMIFGLFFRPGVLLVLIITFVHLLGVWHGGHALRENLGAVELFIMLVGLLFVGPGKYSVDKN